MPRTHDKSEGNYRPQFKRLAEQIQRAVSAWDDGDRVRAQAILRVVGAIALADASELDPRAPIAEVVR